MKRTVHQNILGLAIALCIVALSGCVNEEARQRRITDALYAGLQALDDGRLLNPPEYSAHRYFMRALALEPGNPMALQGLEDILQTYVEMARREMRRGLYNEADELLQRARFVDENRRLGAKPATAERNTQHPELAAAQQELAAQRRDDDLFFDLDAGQLTRRDPVLVSRLHDIARQARQLEAFFLITAPDDETGRWIFLSMREGVEGYRLRGSIEIGDNSSIRLRLPETQ